MASEKSEPVGYDRLDRRVLLGIFAVALGIRLVHVWQIARAPFFSVLMGDSRSYDAWAQRIAAGDWIGHDVFYQAPLYPYFLGVLYAAAGRHLLLVRIVQACLGSLACVWLALAGARLFSRRVGLIAGLMLALYAPAIFFDGLIQKSVLDVFFICLALWLLSRVENAKDAKGAKKHRPLRSWVATGLAIGGLSLTRENALVFTVVMLFYAIWCDGWRTAAAFALGVAIVLTPVAARNAYVGGGFYVTTSQFGPNFYIGNNPRADGTYQALRFGRGAPEYERQDATEIAERATGRQLTPADVSAYWTGQALDFITGHPLAWLKLEVRKVVLLLNAREMLDTESQESHADWSLPLRIAGIVGHFGVLVPLAVIGLIATWSERRRVWILYAMLFGYAASVVAFYVFARYRYPLVPMLVLFAASGAAALPALFRGAVANRTWVTAAIVAAAVFTNWPILSATQMRAVTEQNLGAALQDDGRMDEALTHYRRALDLDPDSAPIYNNIGVTLKAKGDLAGAIDAYKHALRLRPDYAEAQYNLANALSAAGRADEAIGHFEQALPTIGDSADVHNNLGIALLAKGDARQAVREFQEAVRLDPRSAAAHRNLGDALSADGRRDEAIAALRRAVELAPDDALAHYDLASTLLEAERLDEAIAEFRATLRLTPDAVDAHNNLGIALASKGQLDAAIEQFQLALHLKPDFEDARKNLAMALRARGR